MRFTRSANPDEELGSAVAGFALVAPLAVIVFTGVVQVLAVAQLRTVVHSAAATGSRLAATLGSTAGAGTLAADAVLRSHGVAPARASTSWGHSSIRGVPYISLTVTVPTRVPWIDVDIPVSSTVRVTDENAL